MSRSRRVAAKFFRSILGRNLLSRTGRFLFNAGRMDGDEDQRFNGEFLYIKRILEYAMSRQEKTTLFDIGANKGLVTRYAANILRNKGIIYSAEPCIETFATLQSATSGLESKIYLVNAAFSDRIGSGSLQVVGPNEGTNSLVLSLSPGATTQNVQLLTVDDYSKMQGVEFIDFIKIDTEGHDFPVLRGCERMLGSASIGAIQFEYNWRWIAQRTYLKDAFDFLRKYPDYRIGKVTGRGIEIYDEWNPQIETFVESNFAIIKEDHLLAISVIKPWY